MQPAIKFAGKLWKNAKPPLAAFAVVRNKFREDARGVLFHKPVRLAAVLVAMAAALWGQSNGSQPGSNRSSSFQTMAQADRAFVQAIEGGDKQVLSDLLDADFTWTNFAGKTWTRNEVLGSPQVHGIAIGESAEVKQYTYGAIGNIQSNLGREHALRVWVKRPEGWKAIVYQEVMSLEMPPAFAPGAGKDCENPCKGVPYHPKNVTEQQVIDAYSKLETAAMAHNSAVFTTMVGDEFVAVSSNSNKVYDKRGRLDDFDHSKNGGVAPTPLISAHLFDFSLPNSQSGAVLMTSEHKPDRGKPLHVTRLWAKRNGSWVETLSYQTSVQAVTTKR